MNREGVPVASSDKFNFQVITPDRTAFAAEVAGVVLPGVVGQFGVLPDHAPFFSILKIGVMKVIHEHPGKTETMTVAGGFADVRGNEVVVLTQSAERAEEIDVNRAEAARKRAEERIASRAANVDMARAQAALTRALTRLAVAKQRTP